MDFIKYFLYIVPTFFLFYSHSSPSVYSPGVKEQKGLRVAGVKSDIYMTMETIPDVTPEWGVKGGGGGGGDDGFPRALSVLLNPASGGERRRQNQQTATTGRAARDRRRKMGGVGGGIISGDRRGCGSAIDQGARRGG